MERSEVKNRIVDFFRRQIEFKKSQQNYSYQIQMGGLYELFRDSLKDVPAYKQDDFFSIVREVVQEFINIGFLYPGTSGDANSGYPWLSITTHGAEAFMLEDWLPYDPEGYLKALKDKVPEMDNVTFAYIGESISAFNRRHLLSATITLGVASENLMLILIEAYRNWLKDPRKTKFQKRIEDRWIATQYREFKKEFAADVKSLPKELQSDWEIYLDGIFNFVRLNRNDAGHPTGKELSAKVVFANLQIFADYARYIFDLKNYLK